MQATKTKEYKLWILFAAIMLVIVGIIVFLEIISEIRTLVYKFNRKPFRKGWLFYLCT